MLVRTVISAVLATAALAKPITFWPSEEFVRRSDSSEVSSLPSFNNYLGLQQMNNFDNFFGQDNFDSSFNEQTIIVQQRQVVCETQAIEIVQQKLVILTEVMKRILLEQICEVEVQTVVVQQFKAVISSFQRDVIHRSNRKATFDSNIAGMLGQIMNSDGSLNKDDFGFKGTSVGNNSVAVSGNNWDDATSPRSVGKAKDLARQASNSTSKGK